MTPLTDWSTFYQVTGSAAGALTGLQFVTMALIADMPAKPGETDAGEAFATPTVVHFATVLLLTGALSAPWHGMVGPASLLGLTGLFGVVYTTVTVRRMRSQNAYRPVVEDWIFHAVLPLLAYAILTACGPAAIVHPRPALFAEAAAALLLLLIGIHNAWDNVTYLVLRKRTQNKP